MCTCSATERVIKRVMWCRQVPVAMGGPGLPDGVKFSTDLKEPGLANVGPTIINLLGFEAPDNMVPTLLSA